MSHINWVFLCNQNYHVGLLPFQQVLGFTDYIPSTHTHTHTHIYIYIYGEIYAYVWVDKRFQRKTFGDWGFYRELSVTVHTHTHTHIYVQISFEHNRHFLSTYFLLDPFVLPYCFHCIRRELIDVFPIIVYIQSTFCPTLGHHQGRIYYKSDVTFVFAILLCKSIFTVRVYSVCF